MRWYRDLFAGPAGGAQRLVRPDDGPAGPPFPEELLGEARLRHRVVLHRPARPADEVLEPVRSFGNPLIVGMHDMPFTALQSAFDALYPAGLQWYWRADMFEKITDDAIAVHEQFGDTLPTGHSTMHLYPIDGAAERISSDETAFSYRSGGWAGVIVGVDPDPANNEAMTAWAKDYWTPCTRARPVAPT